MQLNETLTCPFQYKMRVITTNYFIRIIPQLFSAEKSAVHVDVHKTRTSLYMHSIKPIILPQYIKGNILNPLSIRFYWTVSDLWLICDFHVCLYELQANTKNEQNGDIYDANLRSRYNFLEGSDYDQIRSQRRICETNRWKIV